MPDGRAVCPAEQYFSRRPPYAAVQEELFVDMNVLSGDIIQMMEKTFSTQRVDILAKRRSCRRTTSSTAPVFWSSGRRGDRLAKSTGSRWRSPALARAAYGDDPQSQEAGLLFSMGSDCHNRLQIGDLIYVDVPLTRLA
jgi:hypothetical protein